MRDHELVHPELLHLARAVRRDGVIREAELDLRKGIGPGRLVVAARVAPLGADHVLLLVEDRSKAARVEEIRRDFLANVSHELKTPVGGIALLAEAILDAHDDPEVVARFAKRISVESDRLTTSSRRSSSSRGCRAPTSCASRHSSTSARARRTPTTAAACSPRSTTSTSPSRATRAARCGATPSW